MFQAIIKSVFQRLKPERKSTKLLSTSAVVAAFSVVFIVPQSFLSNQEKLPLEAFEIKTPNVKYGFALDTFQVEEGIIEDNQYLSGLLSEQGMTGQEIDQIARGTREIFDACLLYTSPSPRDRQKSRMPSSA